MDPRAKVARLEPIMRRRLTYEEAVHIRENVRAGRMTTRGAAQVYKLGQESIRRIVRGETYANPEVDAYGRGIAEELTPFEKEELERRANESLARVLHATQEAAPQEKSRPSALDIFLGKAPLPRDREGEEADAALARLMGEIEAHPNPDTLVEELKDLGEPAHQGGV